MLRRLPHETEQLNHSQTTVQPHNNVAPSLDYYQDEHPEIPRVRRASLRLAPASCVENPQVAKEKEQSERKVTDILVAPRRRPSIYEPPPHRQRQPRSLLTRLQDISHNRSFMVVVVLIVLGISLVPGGITIVRNTRHAIIIPKQSSIEVADPYELVITPQDTDHPAPSVLATSAYLLDADTGATLYAHNPFMHLPMMSTTKLMTALLAVEQGNLDQHVTITDAIEQDLQQLSSDSSVMGIKQGETYTLRELLYGLLLVSGNDAAVAIADTVGGNLAHFVAMMNQRADQLGLHDTHYMNPHGLLTTGHFSSAHDLALLDRYSLNLSVLHQMTGTRMYDIPNSNGNHPEHYLINGNQFLWWYPGVDGGKPGWDGALNFVQVISCVRNHHHLIGVTMHTVNFWTDMRDLMNWGFDNFTWVSPAIVDLHTPIPFDNQANYFAKDQQDGTIPTAQQGRYYISTGFSITDPIMSYFDKNGGLKQFGYPTGLLTAGSGTMISQQFEHSTIQCDTTTKQCRTV